MKNKAFWIVLVLVILLGALLRFIGVFANSFAFTYDVGRDMLAVAQIVYKHKIPLIGFTTGMPGIFYGPWWYYILTIPFALSGGNPQFIDGFMALTGVATSIVFFIFGKKVGNKALGFILAFLVAISPSLVGISAQIWNPNIAPLLVGVLLLVTIRLFHKPGAWTFFFTGILLGLLIDTEIVFGLLFFVGFLLAMMILNWKKMLQWRALFALLGLFIMFSPRIFFELRHQLLMTNTIIKLITQPHVSGNTLTFQNIFAKLVIFFGFYADTVAGGAKIAAGALLIVLATIFIVYFKKFAGMTRKFFLLSCIVIATFIVGIVFFSHDIWPHYLVGLPVLFILVTGIVVNAVVQDIKKQTFIYFFCVCNLFFWLNVQPAQIITSIQKPFIGDASVYRNQLAIIDYVYQQAGGKPFNYVVYTPPIFDYPYQYLFAWYGKNIYHYVPSTDHQQLFFLIIEPDKDHPTLLRDWLKVREKDGKIIKQVKMPSGVTVQEREH
jgi:hypothetical protein